MVDAVAEQLQSEPAPAAAITRAAFSTISLGAIAATTHETANSNSPAASTRLRPTPPVSDTSTGERIA